MATKESQLNAELYERHVSEIALVKQLASLEIASVKDLAASKIAAAEEIATLKEKYAKEIAWPSGPPARSSQPGVFLLLRSWLKKLRRLRNCGMRKRMLFEAWKV
jgi:hypothetical protein